jgi:hypothetical protein
MKIPLCFINSQTMGKVQGLGKIETKKQSRNFTKETWKQKKKSNPVLGSL